MDRPQIKLKDVAKRAGVSTATVSRALSTPEKVSQTVLQRVREAVKECGYVPSGAARALRSRRTRSVGVLIPTLDNAIFASATHALQKSLGEHGYTLLVASHEFDLTRETSLAESLIERGVDGLVLVGLDHKPALYKLLKTFNVPYVLTWTVDPAGHHTYVGFRNRDAAARVATYLMDIGHCSIAMIAGETAHNDRARDRVIGVQQTLAARGRALDPSALLEAPYSFEAGRDAMRALARLQPRPTAVICGNDVLAIGALREAQMLGLNVPTDLSITGFDDLEISSLMVPPLTTVRVPTCELGKTAAMQLLARISGTAITRSREFSVELIVRGSTAPPLQETGHVAFARPDST